LIFAFLTNDPLRAAINKTDRHFLTLMESAMLFDLTIEKNSKSAALETEIERKILQRLLSWLHR
jgi:hypothetical protein